MRTFLVPVLVPKPCSVKIPWATNISTRWYPWLIQQLVSKYSNCHWSRGGTFWKRSDLGSAKKIRVLKFWVGGGCSGKSKPKVQTFASISIFRGGKVFWKVKTQSAKICLNFNFQGGIWKRSDLDSGKKIRVLKWGGVLESQNPKFRVLNMTGVKSIYHRQKFVIMDITSFLLFFNCHVENLDSLQNNK